MKNIEKLLPYMDSEDLYDLAKEVLDGDMDIEIEKLFPFLDEDDLAKLIKDAIEQKKEINFAAAAPFMDEADVYKLARMAIEHKLKVNVKDLLPFMDEEDVDKICKQLVNNPESDWSLSLDDLFPYASEEGIDCLFLHYASQGKFDEGALPFVSDECLHRFVVDYCNNPNFDVDIDALYPYLSSKDISLLLKTYLKRRKQ